MDVTVAGGTMPTPWAHEVNMFAMAVGTMIALLFFAMIVSRIMRHELLPLFIFLALAPKVCRKEIPFATGGRSASRWLHWRVRR
jgi:tellurite resistance protein